MTKRATSETTRQQILNAAAQVIQTHGTEALTLEAVALAAGVSKGGLLYHFPGKSALIGGMIEHVLAAFDVALAEAEAYDEGPQAGRWLRAYLRASFTPAGQQLEVTSGLLAAVASDPTMLAPLQARYALWQQRTENDGLDSARATIVRLALDGLWIADLLGFAPPNGLLREQVRAALLALATDT
jgi:AcrR family transcriptional regulator